MTDDEVERLINTIGTYSTISRLQDRVNELTDELEQTRIELQSVRDELTDANAQLDDGTMFRRGKY